ncbi:hypothetical protein ACJIZ3_001810 [Penstemon smallii]|uniref:Uncharacterized protein n=1 Tax=Penstemon smallii TaxID=265156 RepID=A0ABD3U5R0_9LAMI
MFLNVCVCVIFWFTTAKLCLSIGTDTLSKGQSLSGSQTLISKDEIFELGFFTTGTSSSHNIYLGIWYKDFPERTTVWVANRQTPLPNTTSTSILILSQNGNLGLFSNLDTFWSTNLMSTLPDSTEAVLLDNGNFILRDRSRPSVIFWQSFDHPTDTWLPESPLGFNKINGRTQHIVAWKNTEDPSPGMFSIEISQDETNEVSLLWNMSTRYFKSGAWTGRVFDSLPELSYILNFSFVSNKNETYYTYSLLNYAVFSRLVITPSGKLKQLTSLRNHNHRNWTETSVQPNNGICGAFGIYTDSLSNPCTCLQGFASVSTRPNEWLSGCSRKAPLQCGDSNSAKGKDGFLKTSKVKLPANRKVHPASNARRCKSACLQDCSCTAYTFSESGCLIWDGNLLNLQNDSSSEQSLYLKVANSELRDAKGCLDIS